MKYQMLLRVMGVVLLFLNFLVFPLEATNSPNEIFTKKEYAIVTCGADCGMFRTFASLTGLLHLYDLGYYGGLKVDCGLDGLYYDAAYGPNWWEYYFEPISIGDETNTIPVLTANGPVGIDCAMLTEFQLNKKQVNEIINKYIRIKPYIQNKINDYVNSHFRTSFVIGVHYRGTDKSIEAPRVTYQAMASLISKEAKKHKRKSVKVFIATDEQPFLAYMKKLYPAHVVSYEDAIHSTSATPIHKTVGQKYKKGEDALMDCLLLSKCHVLIKTSSNLSLVSTYFNPLMPVIHASQRPWKAPIE